MSMAPAPLTRFLLFCALSISPHVHAKWQLLYKNSPSGEKIEGDKQQLIKAIRQGLPLRVAWGVQGKSPSKTSVEHVVSPEFVTLTNAEEVFIQTPEHIAQTSYWNVEFQDFNSAQVVWRGLLSTTGRFMATWYNQHTGEPLKRLPQRVTISWFAPLIDRVNPPALFEQKPSHSSTDLKNKGDQ